MSDNPILKYRKVIHPYFHSGYILKNRLLWDLKFESIRSRKRLQKNYNSHSGKKAVILCNGPSLNKTDFGLLGNTFTIGLNKINLLFDKNAFRPSIIVSVNKLVIEQNCDFFKSTDIPVYLSNKGYPFIGRSKNVTYLHGTDIKKFAQNCSFSINEGGTVTYVALQLAFHLGFQEVALIGCDHYFNDRGPANATVVSEKEDSNHFDPNYFGKGTAWQLPDIPQSEYSYHLAKAYYEANGRTVYNCTEGGYLEIFQRKQLKDFLNDD